MGKLKSNFINRNSFNVGFNNRSPLNQYKSTMPTSFDLPKLDGAKVGKHIVDGDQAISNANLENAQSINKSIVGVTDKIAQAIGKKQKDKKDLKAKEARIENMPAFVENWKKENPAYDMDDFKDKYGEEINEWMKKNPGKYNPTYNEGKIFNSYMESQDGKDMMETLKNLKS